MESQFLEPPREIEIGLKKSGVQKIEVALTEVKSKGNKFWFEQSGSLKNQGFEKSGFPCHFN